ncbi:hypothetical protein I551_1179 [Mycobacterium ulcerans str. Harvey]|uniref:Uncharacterized protein n=1 Tax=Mycobacterium ulcerans str. Harvey TaxID=1299332 RepID=A0ABP3AMB5_MYCUL|nr:hypothetical protein I551_1179 [Mycobacterium ulcerans str. Harvey]
MGQRPHDRGGIDRRRRARFQYRQSPPGRAIPAGYAAAEAFLSTWDWADYLHRFRRFG